MSPLDIIRFAMENVETVIILYNAKNKPGMQRIRTEPYEMKVKKGKLYYYAWNLEKNHVASFLADRIMAAELTGDLFVPRPDARMWLKDIL